MNSETIEKRTRTLLRMKIYEKAWKHNDVTRWDTSKYGYEGTSILKKQYEEDRFDSFIFDFKPLNRSFFVERQTLEKFFLEEQACHIIDSLGNRYLFPLKLCKEIT